MKPLALAFVGDCVYELYIRNYLITERFRDVNELHRKSVFFVKVSDTMEGFQFFRKDCIDRLIKMSSDDNGWFYCAELLIRAEKAGYRIAELPVVWNDDYDTKVNVIKLIKNYLCRIVELKLSFGREKLKWIL